jgi:transposase
MITIGVDFHKRTSTYKVLDENGLSIKQKKLINDRETIRQFVDSIQGPKQLAMEATRSWGLYHDTVCDLVDRFRLGHPAKMKIITESETKNDQKDAEMIARLAHSGFFPEAHVSSPVIRQLRSLLRFRHSLVNQRRSVRNQVQTLIDRNLWPTERPQSFKNLFCKRGLHWLQTVPLPEKERFILNQNLKQFHELSEKITEVEVFLNSQSFEVENLSHLRTVPGFRTSKVNALIVLTEASDMLRFRKARAFAHYAGLVPQEFSSGDKYRTGRLVKQANMHLRTALIESTLAAIRADRGLRSYYQQVKARNGSGAAIVATARKLSFAIYHVLKEQRAYRPESLLPSPAAVCHPLAVV